MAHYFLDNRAQPDGAHEVHAVGCKRMASDKRYLGDYRHGDEAVFEARKDFWQIAACVRCMADVSPAPSGRFSQLPLQLAVARGANT